MNPEIINNILNSAKNKKEIDLYDNSIRPIVGYLRDDIKAIKLYDGKILLTDIGEQILKKKGWINYQRSKRKKTFTTYQYIYLLLFTLFGLFGIYKFYSDKQLKDELRTVNSKYDSLLLENKNLFLQIDSLKKENLNLDTINKKQ